MIKVVFAMALDFTKEKDAPHGSRSFQQDGCWMVTQFGPGYSNTYRVIECDEDGLKWLESHRADLTPPGASA